MDYYYKYIKYKNKYLELKGGVSSTQKRRNKKINELLENIPIIDNLKSPTHILFMFLGGLPLKNQHWKRFMETSNEKLICVVHPMVLEGYADKIKGTFWEPLLRDERLLIVDTDHHLKTSWGTKSLTDAQLMMMQYAILSKKRIFRKYVLISENDAPLYNFNVIYKELNSDKKSWFSFFAKGLIRHNWKKIYKHEGGVFDFDEIDVASQWNAIDDSHLEFYFDPIKLLENKKTYEKIDKEFTCNNNSINIVKTTEDTNEKYQKYLDATNGFISNKLSIEKLNNINNEGFCTITDLTFFNSIFKHELKERNLKLLDNLRYNKISYLNDTKNHKQYIIPSEWENEYLHGGIKQAFISNNTWDSEEGWDGKFRGEFSDKNRIWYGSDLTFNQNRLSLNFIENKDFVEGSWLKSTQKKWLLFENGILKQYTDAEKEKKTKDFCKSLRKYDDIEGATDYYIISNSYTDFSLVGLDPNNVLRSFNYTKFVKDNQKLDLFEGKKIGDILKDNANENLEKLLSDKSSKNIKIKILPEEFTINLKRHPLEYSKWNLTQIINAYNFLIFFEISNKPDRNDFIKDKGIDLSHGIYNKIKEYAESKEYAKIVIEEKLKFISKLVLFFKDKYNLDKNIELFRLTILGLLDEYYTHLKYKGKYAYIKARYYYDRMINLNKEYVEECIDDSKKYYIFKKGIPDSIKFNNDYGVPMTSFFLNNALTNGSLFIRKSTDTSNVEEFTEQLFKIEEYALNNKKEYEQRTLIDSKDVPYKYELNKSEEDKLKEEIERIYKDEPNDLYILYLISINNWNGITAAKDFMMKYRIPIISKPKLKQQEQYVSCNKMEFYK